MQVLISDNDIGEKRHVNTTPKGIDTPCGRDHRVGFEVDSTVDLLYKAQAMPTCTQVPLGGDRRKDLDLVRVSNGGSDVQCNENKIYKNMNTEQGLNELGGFHHIVTGTAFSHSKSTIEHVKGSVARERLDLQCLTCSYRKLFKRQRKFVPVAGARPDQQCILCRDKYYHTYTCQMDNTVTTAESTAPTTTSTVDIVALQQFSRLSETPLPQREEEYIQPPEMPNFIRFEGPTAPAWVRDIEAYHDIGDLYMDSSTTASSVIESVSMHSEGPDWRSPYWDSDSRSHNLIFQQYQERANNAMSRVKMKLDMDKVLLYSEKIALLCMSLSAQTTYRGFISTIVYALKDFGVISTRRSLFISVIRLCREYLDSDVGEQFEEYAGDLDEDEYAHVDDQNYTTQSAEKVKIALDAVIDCLRNPSRIAKNPIVRGIVRFLRAITALGMMTYCQGDYCLKGIKLFAIEPITGGVFEVFVVLADSLQNFLDYGYAMVMEKSVFPVNYSFDKLHDLELRVAEMDAWMPFFENGRLSERGMQRSDYLIKLKSLKEHIIAVRRAAPDKFAEKTLTALYGKMEKLSTRATMVTLASGLKYCPFGYSIAGPAGIGKSSVNDHLINYFFQWKKTTQNWKPEGKDAEYRVTVNMSDKFQSEVFSHHIVATLDDFMNKRAEKVAPGETPHDLLIKIVNNVPCTALKPDVESKGAVPMNFELVGLTTNVPHLHATLFVNDEYSILRRVGFTVFQYVKPEFRKVDQECLDPVKAMGHTDLWNIDVLYPIAVKEGNKMVIKWVYYDLPPSIATPEKTKAKNLNLHDLLVLFGHELDRHHAAQIRLLKEACCEDKTCSHGFPKAVCSLCAARVADVPLTLDTEQVMSNEIEQSNQFLVNSEPIPLEDGEEEELQFVPGPDFPISAVRKYKRVPPIEEARVVEPVDIICDASDCTPIHTNKDRENIPVPNYGFSDDVSVRSDTTPFIVHVQQELFTAPFWFLDYFESFVDVFCPWRLTDNPIHINKPWLIDWVPRVVLNKYPDLIEISHFSRTTIRNRRCIAALISVLCPVSCLWVVRDMWNHTVPFFSSCTFILLILFLAHMHNQHADMVARYYVQRNLRWSNLLTLSWMPRIMKKRLKYIWTLVFVLGVVTCLKKIFNKIVPLDKMVVDAFKKKKQDEPDDDVAVDGDCQGGIVSIPNARPVWGGVQCVPIVKPESITPLSHRCST